ncbi:MAG TPA: flagellar hook-associated protein FlgK [Gryllotalpicola sp.]
MTSTFSGLETAYSGLTAARDALNVTGQNMTNAGTPGYTRQRLEQSSAVGAATATHFASPQARPGQGVQLLGISRITDELANARLRSAQGQSGFTGLRANALQTLEDGLGEPGSTGLGAQLQAFWSSWQDLSNNPGQNATGAVVLSDAQGLVAQLSSGYRAVASQWSGLRTQIAGLADQVNQAADQIAALNGSIQQALASGASANELMDQRDQLTSTVAQLVGGRVSQKADGTVDVFVAGNVLVTGQSSNHLQVTGASALEGAASDPVQLEWQNHPGQAIDVDGGQIAASLTLLAPAAADGSGGVLAQSAEAYNQLATALASQVNAVHETAATTDGRTGLDFFALAAGVPAALGLSVVPTTRDDIAVAAPGAGPLDGSKADEISQLGAADGSPDALWAALVSSVGTASQSAQQQDALAGASLQSATTAQQSVSSVDTDQENLDMVTEQSAYQSAARVMTTVDQLLDTLINHTGLVGIQ